MSIRIDIILDAPDAPIAVHNPCTAQHYFHFVHDIHILI